MGEFSKIQWTDHTFNPWIGCTKVSPGCANCYAENLMDKRYGRARWGNGNPRSRTSEMTWNNPVKWNATAKLERKRYRVFCASLADVFDDQVPIQWLADLFTLIWKTPHLDWLLLTKRPQNIEPRLSEIAHGSDENLPVFSLLPFNNIWFGVSVENQDAFENRVPILAKIPAKIRFLSLEPLLGDVELRDGLGIDWAIIGGESGANSRRFESAWARNLVHQCRALGISPFVKQLGRVSDIPTDDPKGGNPYEWPGDLRVREFPTNKAA